MSKTKSNAHSSEDLSSSSGSSSSISSDEEVDARDLKPIREYLSDRRELARQLFKSVKTEKIQMMLPQVLKRMDFSQLESCCANELSGMSRSRILSILDGKPMLESSATSESDDSGPSLEIISDTEEWFSDEDTVKKEDGAKCVKGKIKKERIKQKGKPQLVKKNDNKSVHKKVDSGSKSVQVKVEEDGAKNKEKEGDSLLDLLELEMRARAIRALIRKEEDIIPNSSKSANSNETSKTNAAAAAKAEQEELKEKENCRRQLERIIGAQQSSVAEDEDVVLVVQPTPTIELISSDSEAESHGGVRVNKKLQNERVMETENTGNNNQNKDSNNVHNVKNIESSEKNEVAESVAEAPKEQDVSHKSEVTKRTHSNNESADNQLKSSSKRRKLKKKSRAREQSKSTVPQTDAKDTKADESAPQNVKINETNDNSKNQDSNKESSSADKAVLDEEKSIDMDEIIDLDNYCDDMDDLENTETDKKKQTVDSKQSETKTGTNPSQKSNGTETWASRYYQTDDVQNVIKESKIQSEIRKRLRERQRLSKMSASPNKNSSPSPNLAETNNKLMETDPLGSVNEYLALKQITAVNFNALSSNNDSAINSTQSSTDIRTDANKVIENDVESDVLPGNQRIDADINLSEKAIVDIVAVANSENVNNFTNPD